MVDTMNTMQNTPLAGRRTLPAPLFVLAVLALLLVTGCQKTVLAPPSGSTADIAVAEDGSLRAQAAAAFARGEYPRAEVLYDRLLQLPDLSPSLRVEAWQRFALSAVANGKPHLGLDALEQWRALEPDADISPEWRNAFAQALSAMPSRTAISKLSPLLTDTTRPWPLRADAALLLAKIQWAEAAGDAGDADPAVRRATISSAMKRLALLYEDASQEGKMFLEQRLFSLLQTEDATTVAHITGLLTPEDEIHFPYSIVLLEKASRSASDSADWPMAWQAIQRLRQTNALADTSLLNRTLAPLEQAMGRPVQGIALALPLTGQYGGIGWKIMRGVGVAQWELTKQGNEISVTVINTADKGWEEALRQLPPETAIVGGPLRKDIFARMQATGITQQRNVFAFLSSLDNGKEGASAWRFFSSPQDQARTLLRFAKEELGISRYGVLYPDETYGAHMNTLFSAAGNAMGATTEASASYSPDTQTWGGVLKQFLRVPARRPGENDPMPPAPPFEAVFLPDGWQRMQVLLPHFFFFQEDRLVFLGSALWEQGLSTEKDIETRYANLAVFPGSWNPSSTAPAAVSLNSALDESGLGKPDLWVGLGYDFIRFAALLSSEGVLSAAEMNARIQTAQQMDWSIAPIHWTEEGVASQRMFLFTPTSKGFTPLDPEKFRARLEETRARHDARVEMLEQEYQKSQQ